MYLKELPIPTRDQNLLVFLFGWAWLHTHCCWVCLGFYSFPQKEELQCLALVPACCTKGFPNSLLSSISSHINRKTQYENPVLEAKRKKQLEQQQQPPEGWHPRGHGGWSVHGECPPWPWQHPATVCPSLHGKGCVCPAQRMQQRRKSKLDHLSVEGFYLVKQERFFFECPLFPLESF